MADQARDPHLDALADAIMQHLNGPAPTAPTPPAFTGLSPLAAAAGAMNPQQIPTLIQKQMGPAQAQYQQQQAAFEQAMMGRREALQAGTTLQAAGIRSDAAVDAARYRSGPMAAKGQMRFVDDPERPGKLVLQEFVPDGQGGFMPGKILARGPEETMRFLASTEGFMGVGSRTGETSGFVPGPGGQPLKPAPPVTAALEAARTQASMAGLGSIKKLWADTQPKLRGPASYQGLISTGQQYAPNLTKDLTPDVDYNAVQNFDSGVNRFVADEIFRRSGKAATDAERAMFRQFFPLINDSEQVVDDKLQRMAQAMDREYGAIAQEYPAVDKRKRIRRSNLNRLPKSEQDRAVREGWTIIEGQ